MKRFIYLTLSLIVLFGLIVPKCSAQRARQERNSSKSPTAVLETIKHNANSKKSEAIQNTEYDVVSSNPCAELSLSSSYTITNTLCNIKDNSDSYLQYVVYIGLVLATIIVIRNGFKLVTSPDRSKQIGKFRQNIIYIVIGVILLLTFYWILDIFLSLSNFLEK